MNIFVNGNTYALAGLVLSYEEVKALALLENRPVDRITWTTRFMAGELTPGECVEARPGMAFKVVGAAP